MFMSFIFEKLEVYQRAVDFAERIETLSKGVAGQGYYHLLEQLRRASVSISLNIAEGNGRWHPRDRKNFSGSHEDLPSDAFPWSNCAGDRY